MLAVLMYLCQQVFEEKVYTERGPHTTSGVHRVLPRSHYCDETQLTECTAGLVRVRSGRHKQIFMFPLRERESCHDHVTLRCAMPLLLSGWSDQVLSGQ